MTDIIHHPGCTADYPEKPADELPQQLTSIPLDSGEVVFQCVDCGAFVVQNSQTTDELLKELLG